MNTQQILIYSDSLTWGIIPNTRQRLPFEARWPGVMECALLENGHAVRVIEDCLNGRRTAFADPFKPGRNGLVGLEQRIEVNSPLELVILMLGTNDFQSMHSYNIWHSGQGIAALQILNILEGYDIAGMGFGSAEYLHTLVEAKKLAFEDRAKYYADMDFVNVPVAQLISKDYANERRKLISATAASKSLPAGDEKLDEGDTIYLTVADKDGNMVSLIQSNYRGMGSGMTPGELGFVLQDRAELFALDADHANVVAGGKRPFHTIIPAFVMKDGKPLMSFGLMGGAMQPQGHAQIVVNMVDFGMNLQEAGDAARVNHRGSSQPTGTTMTDGGVVHLESTFSNETREKLKALGHRLGDSNGSFGGYQAILWDEKEGVYYGASEVRKDGQAAGY